MRKMIFDGSLILTAVAVLALGSLSWAQVTAYEEHQRLGMESHIGKLTGHASAAQGNYRRYCLGCHGELGDGEGENAQWIDPKPRNFTLGIFKCRSTPTGTLPLDSDLYETVGRGLITSNMPSWNPLSSQERADLVAYVKHFSARFVTEKPGTPIEVPPGRRSPPTESRPGRRYFSAWNAGSATDQRGEETVRPPPPLPTIRTGRFFPIIFTTTIASSAAPATKICTRFS